MRKKLVAVAVFCSAMLAYSQDAGDDQVPKNKKGREILPKEGDIALGFNTIPVLNVFLGAINQNSGFSGADNMVQYTNNSNNQIVGKYYLNAKTAIRVRFGINTLSGTVTNQVQDAGIMALAATGTQDDIYAASLVRVNDKLTFTKSNMLLSVGIEKRRGYRRLQGFYGAELGIGNTGSKQQISYGNKFSDQYPVQFTSDFNNFNVTTVNPNAPGRTARTLDARNSGGIRMGVRGFIGVEYFIFAKISIAVEYGWAYSITTRRAARAKQEVYNNGANGPEVHTEIVDIDSKETLRGFSVDNNNGSVFSLNNTIGGNTGLSGGAGALTLLFHF